MDLTWRVLGCLKKQVCLIYIKIKHSEQTFRLAILKNTTQIKTRFCCIILPQRIVWLYFMTMVGLFSPRIRRFCVTAF